MIFIPMSLSILSLIFVIVTAYRAISNIKSLGTKETPQTTLISEESTSKFGTKPLLDSTSESSLKSTSETVFIYNDNLDNTSSTYYLRPELLIKVLFLELTNTLGNTVELPSKNNLSFQLFHPVYFKKNWVYYSPTGNTGELTFLLEDSQKEEILKALFSIELKVIRSANIEKDYDDVFSDLFYYNNKEEGAKKWEYMT